MVEIQRNDDEVVITYRHHPALKATAILFGCLGIASVVLMVLPRLLGEEVPEPRLGLTINTVACLALGWLMVRGWRNSRLRVHTGLGKLFFEMHEKLRPIREGSWTLEEVRSLRLRDGLGFATLVMEVEPGLRQPLLVVAATPAGRAQLRAALETLEEALGRKTELSDSARRRWLGG